MSFKIPQFTIHSAPALMDLTPWNLKMISAPSFWEKSKGGGRIVAVIDSGLDVNHPELVGRVINPTNTTNEAAYNDVTDTLGHGTHVAGIIAGKTVGVAPEARIMPFKVGVGANLSNNAIHEAMRHILNWNKKCSPADKIVAVNCSFSGGFYDAMMAYFIRELVADGVCVCVAAGNSGDGKEDTHEIFSFPAYIEEVITVSSINQDGNISNYSNSFDGVDIAAPGTEVYSCFPNNQHKVLSGTSMATPHVTGACALLVDMFYKREGRLPSEGEIDNACEHFPNAEGVLFKHAKKSGSSYLYGRGILDLTYSTTRWPLYRVQVGAFYNQSGQMQTQNNLKKSGFSTYSIKY